MKIKISSDITFVFKIAMLLQVFALAITFIIMMLLKNFIFIIIGLSALLIGFFIIKGMGITKLKTVYKNDNSIIIENGKIPVIIPFKEIRKIDRTFLLNDFPYRIHYGGLNENKKLYFLPKGNFFKDLFSEENQTIEELRNEIKKTKANTGNRCTSP